MKIVLYARVSKALEQNPENQLIDLRRWASAMGHEVQGEYVDEVSSRDTRPQKEECLRLIRRGEAQGVAFWALDRWGRNMGELVLELEEFSKQGYIMFSHKEGLDLSTAAGRLMANVLAAMANFERERLRERTNLGLSRATAQGKIKGRHPVGCGCGKRLDDGTVHNGDIKPMRDSSNRFIGWLGLEEARERERLKKAARKIAKQIPMNTFCDECGVSDKLERHHPDYNFPKVFMTLCRKCHEKQTPPVQPIIFSEEAGLS